MHGPELRQDLVSHDWIVIADFKGKPHEIRKDKTRVATPLDKCPFEVKHDSPLLLFTKDNDWSLQVFENKFPAFIPRGTCSHIFSRGPYRVAQGVGHHELVVTRDHQTDFGSLPQQAAEEVFRAFQERYRTFLKNRCISYVAMFHNWGPLAGASVYHPHYQIIAIPIVPPDVEHSLIGSTSYFKKHKECVHCAMMRWELEQKSRVVYENEEAVVFAPFASRSSFELRIFPKEHLPYFETTQERTLGYVAEALREALRLLKTNLNDPDYNFFIHTAPVRNRRRYGHYHWHIEILPKLSTFAGFELGTGIDINPTDPDQVARILRHNL